MKSLHNYKPTGVHRMNSLPIKQAASEQSEITFKNMPFDGKIGSNMHLIETEILQNETELYHLVDEWDDLAMSSGATVYMTPDWVLGWWKHFGKHPRRSLYVITLRYAGSLIAIAPCFTGYSTIFGKKAETRMQILGSGGSPDEQFGFMDDYGISDFLDFIVAPDFTSEAVSIFAELLIAATDDFDTISFHQVREDSFIMKYLYPALQGTHLSINIIHTDNCPYINLREYNSMDDFIKKAKSNARRRFRQTRRASMPGANFKISDKINLHETEGATEKLIELHQERWIDLGFPGVFYDARFTRFFKELIQSSHRKNRIWFKQASDMNGACAMRLMLKYNGRYYDYISGFDHNAPSAKFRPGFGILLNSVEDALSHDIETIEMLRGEEGYKYDFTDKAIKNMKLVISRPGRESIKRKMVHILAFAWKVIKSEKKVLHAHYKKNGLVRILPGYFKFRFNSVLSKLKK